jgi:hypothetical protein
MVVELNETPASELARRTREWYLLDLSGRQAAILRQILERVASGTKTRLAS